MDKECPCYMCGDRTVGCHSVCEKYSAYRVQKNLNKKAKNREKFIHNSGKGSMTKRFRSSHE